VASMSSPPIRVMQCIAVHSSALQCVVDPTCVAVCCSVL